MDFKNYLLNEQTNYFSERIGDILEALQSLAEDYDNLGNKDKIKTTIGIVNQIRLILRDSWEEGDLPKLKELQKIGVALMQAVDGGDNLKDAVHAATTSLEDLVNKLQTPINQVGEENQESD